MQGEIEKLQEEMKYITIGTLLVRGVEKNFTIIEKDYAACLASKWPGDSAFLLKP